MAEKKTIEQVADVIRTEGMGYAITDYMSANSIADPKLSELWAAAFRAIDAIDVFMIEKLGDDWQWD